MKTSSSPASAGRPLDFDLTPPRLKIPSPPLRSGGQDREGLGLVARRAPSPAESPAVAVVERERKEGVPTTWAGSSPFTGPVSAAGMQPKILR